VTQENFSRIRNGMTQQQVIAILGEPSESSSIDIGGLSGTAAKWIDGNSVITIQFVNDKVQARQFNRSGQPE
jgi:hypothetical protein